MYIARVYVHPLFMLPLEKTMSPHIEKFMALGYEDRLTLRAAAKGGDTKMALPLFETYFSSLTPAEISVLMKDIAGLAEIWFR